MRGVEGRIFPRLRAEIVRDKTWNVSCAVEAHGVCHCRPNRGGFETLRLRNGPTGHKTAVAPTANPQARRVSDPHRQDRIDALLQIAIVTTAPILHVGEAKRFAI